MVGTGRVGNNGSMFSDGYQHLRRSHHTGVLGPCTFVARYGAPGARRYGAPMQIAVSGATGALGAGFVA